MKISVILKNLDKRVYLLGGLLILLALLFYVPNFFRPSPPPFSPSVRTSDPVNGALEVSEQVNVEIYFKGEVPLDERQNFRATASPSVQFTTAWPRPDRLLLIPDSPLVINSRYTVNVDYKETRIYTLTFTTTAFSEADLQQQAVEQTENDLDFSEELYDFSKEYPWYVKLPIDKVDYKILYDFNREEFRIPLYIDPGTPEDQQNIIKNRALSDIRTELGAEPEEVGYYFHFAQREQQSE